MTRLLDGHPDLLVFPIEIKYFRHSDFPTSVRGVQLARHSTPRDVLSAAAGSQFFRTFLFGSDESYSQPFSIPDAPPGSFDREAFLDALNDTAHVATHRDAFCHFFVALARGKQTKSDHWRHLRMVEKTPLQEQYIDTLLQWFPDAKFVHMVRNPYALDVSNLNRDSGSLKVAMPTMKVSYRLALENEKRFPDRVTLVRYEDLVSDPVEVVKQVASFVDLKWSKELLRPSILGVPWSGNSSNTDDGYTGISSSSLNAWQSQVKPLRVRIINRYLPETFAAFGYKQVQPSWKFWKGYENARDLLTDMRFAFAMRNIR